MSEPPRSKPLQAKAIATMWRLLARCSPALLWRLARGLGPLVHRLSARERQVTEINLREVFPEQNAGQRRRLARDSLCHSTATMLELGFAWMGAPQRVERSIHAVHGRELLDEARAAGRGVIVLAPHFGNWEVLNFWLSSHFPFTAMYEPPKITELDPVIRRGRERMGAALVPTNARGVAALLKALKGSQAVGILPDQEPDWSGGVFADFYHRPAYTATLLPKLVARTRARVVTGVARRLARGDFEIHFLAADERVYDPDEAVAARGVNASVEAVIDLDPAQYQWEYKRYRKTPEEQQDHPEYRRFRLYR
ncbi:lysophospholipid acyltransferase family protein [Modicisalibacter coralii]|uniref:lysophospholipid acyltransferase family protein n=1 Tax=Modicisalibacter coralii TaxID=2304602 RepID=UPI00100B4AF5|nr:lysophospholipid acyltransferase family protein [Halomonas coralii]